MLVLLDFKVEVEVSVWNMLKTAQVQVQSISLCELLIGQKANVASWLWPL